MMKIVLLLVLLVPTPASAQHSERRQTAVDRPLPEFVALMEDEQRVTGLQVERVVEILKIRPNTKIADIGAGSGLFTRPLARRVGQKGVVYAVEIRQDLVDYLQGRAREQKLDNVRAVLAAEDDPRLPEPVDLMVIIDTLHHIRNQPAYLRNLSRYLRPGGRIAIIDFKKVWPANHEELRYTVEDLQGWMRSAVFEHVESHDFLENNFFTIYRKPSGS